LKSENGSLRQLIEKNYRLLAVLITSVLMAIIIFSSYQNDQRERSDLLMRDRLFSRLLNIERGEEGQFSTQAGWYQQEIERIDQRRKQETIISIGQLVFMITIYVVLVATIWMRSRVLIRRVIDPLVRMNGLVRLVDKEQFKEAYLSAGRYDEIAKLLGTFIKISQDRESAEIEMQNAVLEAMQANSSKSNFLATMSHEIRTPMNAIVGMVNILEEAENGEKVLNRCEMLSVIKRNGDALMTILNDILDLSKIEAGKMELYQDGFDLYQLCSDVVDTFQVVANERGLEIKMLYGEGVSYSRLGDISMVRRVIMNLFSNAVKFTSQGHVILKVKALPGQSDWVRIEVEDTGKGISPERIDDIFNPFTQEDDSITRQFGGTGLGLNLCKELVKFMGGKLSLTSAIGRGSTFCADIPLAIEVISTDALVAIKKAKLNFLSIKGVKILLAEDSEDNVLLIKTYLERYQVELDLAPNGAEAVEKFKTTQYDLVLMDMQMPVMDGYTAVETIRKIEQDMSKGHTPIYALTAYAFRSDKERSQRVGCDGHISKPVSKELLVGTIKDAISPSDMITSSS
jgi:signal transduction histidine kinase/ActR/RegA family two-component response regulator